MSKDAPSGVPIPKPSALVGGSVSRLPSIRPSRDLTLGGSAKKTFTPNIPVKKVKEEPKPAEEKAPDAKPISHSAERKDKKKDGERGRDNKGRGNQANIIQTHSIFEEGPAAQASKSHGGGGGRHYGGGGGGGGGASAAKDVPSISKAPIKREKMEEGDDDAEFAAYLRDDFVVYRADKNDDDLNPISLPLLPAPLRQPGRDLKADKKSRVKVKQEPGEGEEPMEVDTAPALSRLTVGPSTNTGDLFLELNADPEEASKRFILFQLPEVLPLMPPEKDQRRANKHDGASTSAVAAASNTAEVAGAKQQDSSCGLSDFPSGPIGKLRVHKSGRVSLVLGGLSLDVNQGTPVGYLQELVSMHMEGSAGGDMCVLGQVTDKLICSPPFQLLLEDR